MNIMGYLRRLLIEIQARPATQDLDALYKILKNKYPNYRIEFEGDIDDNRVIRIFYSGPPKSIGYYIYHKNEEVFEVRRMQWLPSKFSPINKRLDDRKIGVSPNIAGVLKLLQNRIK